MFSRESLGRRTSCGAWRAQQRTAKGGEQMTEQEPHRPAPTQPVAPVLSEEQHMMIAAAIAAMPPMTESQIEAVSEVIRAAQPRARRDYQASKSTRHTRKLGRIRVSRTQGRHQAALLPTLRGAGIGRAAVRAPPDRISRGHRSTRGRRLRSTQGKSGAGRSNTPLLLGANFRSGKDRRRAEAMLLLRPSACRAARSLVCAGARDDIVRNPSVLLCQ